jgi:AcrR family transcriptional regulator
MNVWQAGSVTSEPAGLRERKKQATQKSLREAALRLALELGPENVRVDDIAEAAGVSPRTYNNYFSSREQAIVAAITAERDARVAVAIADRDLDVRLADAIGEAIVREYTGPGDDDRARILLTTSSFALREAFLGTVAGLERSLTEVLVARLGETESQVARVLAASVAAAVRIALEQWLTSAPKSTSGLVVLTGSLADLLGAALAPLTPALDAAEQRATAEPG